MTASGLLQFGNLHLFSGKDANLNRRCGIETRCVCTKRASTYGLLEQKMPQEDQHL